MDGIQLSLFGKTYPVPSAATKGRTSAACSKPSSESAQKYQFLDLRTGAGILPERSWVTDSPLRGGSSTRNTGEYPSGAEEYMLSQILVENPPKKYYLSIRAMDGILTRASRRGKPLPDLLITAINGMKDWLVQTDLSATLATNNDQTLLPQCRRQSALSQSRMPQLGV